MVSTYWFITLADNHGLVVKNYDSVNQFMDYHFSHLQQMSHGLQPVFVNHIPTDFNEVMVISGKVVIPQPVTKITEWTIPEQKHLGQVGNWQTDLFQKEMCCGFKSHPDQWIFTNGGSTQMHQLYYFTVSDQDGFWGMIRQRAETEEQAREIVREHLDRHEVDPNGSLDPVYELTKAVNS